MASHEGLVGHIDDHNDKEPISQTFLKTVFQQYQQLPYDTPLEVDIPPVIKDILTSTALPATTTVIESALVTHSRAKYDTITNRVAPETATLTLKGYYTSSDFIDERLLSLSIGYDETEDTYMSFASQVFCDPELYSLSYAEASDQKILATDPNLLQYDTIAMSASSFSGDVKRTATYRPLDEADLALLARVSDQFFK
ncbi:hypothetical protein I8H84_03550 [Candidatus Saccharibacteria bacterium]|nr:hypothetical protein [Candidatus Saccharibacteria bacterium]MBH1973021.1 hypothetical protein [Candidatus Saccharibacteria bacterium]MBH1991224.1 hypothetical protein [Candidatus Saccharibacteria bacterium]